VSTSDGRGSWIARTAGGSKYIYQPLGTFEGIAPKDLYEAASTAAREWFIVAKDENNASQDITVGIVCLRYTATHPNEVDRINRFLIGTPLARVKLSDLTRKDVQAWVDNLKTIQVSNGIGESHARADIDREVCPLRAALNQAHDLGEIATDTAWRMALRIKKNKKKRDLYLTREQRKSLLENMSAEAKPFFTALCLTPIRPGAVALLTVKDFDTANGVLNVSNDKGHEPRKIQLSESTADFFRAQVQGKKADAPIFQRNNGLAWNKDAWKYPIAHAVEQAGLPAETTAYTLRHSVITDLITGGLDLFTTAKIAGTGVDMISKHYGHLLQHHAKDAMAKLEL